MQLNTSADGLPDFRPDPLFVATWWPLIASDRHFPGQMLAP
jgi:hypothetical protein